jgi:hypothetical protein
MTVFYGQYKCTGTGANYAGRVRWSGSSPTLHLPRLHRRVRVAPIVALARLDGCGLVKKKNTQGTI